VYGWDFLKCFSMGSGGGGICFLVYESLNSSKSGLFYGNDGDFLWVLNLGIFLIRL